MKTSLSRISKPDWLKKALPPGGKVSRTERLIKRYGLNTVCHGAKCPNRNDCYHRGTATFLILGRACTRDCGFCSIERSDPAPPDPHEPERMAEAVAEMGLRYVVVTSVTRDDIADGGASHFSAVIRALRARKPGVRIEVLVPDFQGNRAALDAVLDAGPTVLNHNVETVPALYPRVRPEADYGRSLELLRRSARREGLPVKSGIMVGLGEKDSAVTDVLEDLRGAGVSLVTIGQYLQPGPGCLDVAEYVEPERFVRHARSAARLGFTGVASGPFVRSSHRAAELYDGHVKRLKKR